MSEATRDLKLYGFEEAGHYLGQSKANMKHHYYNTRYLRGQKKCNVVLFSQAQLDWFGMIDFAPGRPPIFPGVAAPDPPKLFTFREAGDYLGLHRRTIEYHYYTTFKLRGFKVSKAVVFTRAQLLAFDARRKLDKHVGLSARAAARDQLMAALKVSRGWAEPRLWKGRGLRPGSAWGWWAVGPAGKSEFLGRNLEAALASARRKG